MPLQLRLFSFQAEDKTAATLLLSDSNGAAWGALGRWRDWPLGVMILSGPRGSGKSHMAAAWAELAGAQIWNRQGRALEAFDAAQGRLVIDPADGFEDEAHLALLLDAAKNKPGAALLLVARDRPDRWPVRLIDLRSRLVAAPLVRLDEPDERLLGGVLKRLCKAKFIKLTDKACDYLLRNMERSFEKAHALAQALDELHVGGARPISIALATKALKRVDMEQDGHKAARDALAEDA